MNSRLALQPQYYLLIVVTLISCSAINNNEPTKINGASVVAPPIKFTTQDLSPLTNIGTNAVSIMPYAYVNETSGELQYNMVGKQWWGETLEGTEACILMAHELNLNVMLKPHVWIGWGVFTGTYKPSIGYSLLKKTYRNYVMDNAILAQKHGVEYFCFGTEWKQFIADEPAYFDSLIADIKSIYQGKITYAANWDNAFRIPFWNQLDMIGIDAYFPLTSENNPNVLALNKAWLPWKTKIKELSETHKKNILFTEYGYRNIDACTNKPWESHNSTATNDTCQCNAYQSLFDTFWSEPWFAGGFFWKYHTQLKNNQNNLFTPQQKPTFQLIKKQYLKAN